MNCGLPGFVQTSNKRKIMRVVFLHPDLGIGGAERLVVDAATALTSCGHQVKVITAHHDRTHCFQETRDGSVDVLTAGDWLPRSLFGRCYAACAYLRMIYVALYLCFFSSIHPQVVFCDQISACVPFLRLFGSATKILFYCHFPDLLLTERKTFFKYLYRAPLDYVEERTTGMAHCVLVNSKFTGEVFRKTFPSLSHVTPRVLYPSLNMAAFDKMAADMPQLDVLPKTADTVFLSINRFERKKNLQLAIESFGELRERASSAEWASCHLVIAGGYDSRVLENVQHHEELQELASKLEISNSVTFLKSPEEGMKLALLRKAACILYTPEKEHFGIVPVEAMYMRCPVIAVNSGGPLETVVDGETGFLVPERKFAAAMFKFVRQKDLREKMGEACRRRVVERFSFAAFTKNLNEIIAGML